MLPWTELTIFFKKKWSRLPVRQLEICLKNALGFQTVFQLLTQRYLMLSWLFIAYRRCQPRSLGVTLNLRHRESSVDLKKFVTVCERFHVLLKLYE